MSSYFGVPYKKIGDNYSDVLSEANYEGKKFVSENGAVLGILPGKDFSIGKFYFKFIEPLAGNPEAMGFYDMYFNSKKVMDNLGIVYSVEHKIAVVCSYNAESAENEYFIIIWSSSGNSSTILEIPKILDPDTGNELDSIIPPIEKPNSIPPVILDIADITAYKGEKFLLQFYSYDVDGFISQFYFSLDGGSTYGKFNPNNMGGHVYINRFLFDSLGEYSCKIKVYDNEGLSSESNEFKINIIPSIYENEGNTSPPKVSNSDQIIIYGKNSTEFESNGLGILKDCISCIVENELNGIYEIELCYPVGTKFDDYLLDTEYIIKCNVDNFSNSQLFRIYDSEYIMESNRIIVRGRHITYDLKDNFVEGVSFISSNCESVAQGIISSCEGSASKKFKVKSNISVKKNFSVSMVNTLDALLGIEGSVLDIFGTKDTIIKRDNFNLNISNESTDKGFIVAYRKNLTGFKRKINIENVITKIYPYSITSYGKIITLKEKFISSKNSNIYVNEKIESVEFAGDILSENDLRNEALNYFSINQIDLPSINYEVDFEFLYKNNSELSILEKVSLGDIVTVNDEKIGLNVKARVLKIVYNVISKRYEKIELGNFKNEYRLSKKQEIQKLVSNIRKIKN